MKARTYLLISGVIFGLVCLGHLLRVDVHEGELLARFQGWQLLLL